MSDTFHPGIQETGDYLAHGRSIIGRVDHFAPDNPPPQRAVRLVLDVHADTIDDIEDAFCDILRSLRLKSFGGTSGSVSRGYHFEVAQRDVTHDEFVAELLAWRESDREARS